MALETNWAFLRELTQSAAAGKVLGERISDHKVVIGSLAAAGIATVVAVAGNYFFDHTKDREVSIATDGQFCDTQTELALSSVTGLLNRVVTHDYRSSEPGGYSDVVSASNSLMIAFNPPAPGTFAGRPGLPSGYRVAFNLDPSGAWVKVDSDEQGATGQLFFTDTNPAAGSSTEIETTNPQEQAGRIVQLLENAALTEVRAQGLVIIPEGSEYQGQYSAKGGTLKLEKSNGECRLTGFKKDLTRRPDTAVSLEEGVAIRVRSLMNG